MFYTSTNNYYFEIFPRLDQKWGVRFKAPNHEIVFASEGYNSKQSAKYAIDLLKQFAPTAQIKEKAFA